MANTLTVSINKEQKEFLDEHEFISPSAIFQDAVNEIMERQKLIENSSAEKDRKIAALEELLTESRQFIRNKGLGQEFQESRVQK